ncbi:hypothetical protein A2526_05410 [candidate division WOR-1 bacterium RIFOXYD2_FULL_36_8]|uniref:DUF2905 domain-containing protein n=1 Tax=candidate division WOR-1 bacterium RIFOXYB2_FULL_36_35 TaxID=1802578 RepID=A0A1F4S8P4_UNCSA|nr:MAG: hypothetical protein A2230_07345 [candidate division WOR-1 bacterium RIFOXYA2_FULL_36_21]OGC16800.1 MAG: hypothetical protein A2290_07945 [candidate division WOR-1 bacterium RIFOXYB2_FULL_36_35]OGC19815.1 MAG: hypothetical protein A2282_01095 [candidate division WOR-1 bacterium RIFOXYA12_FULL_36_13]OGC37306.1 MAG: hypothetical protein A2526_05410 [candidate division WOR-1 bacterium RIFOXYD2_FULL_36_8]
MALEGLARLLIYIGVGLVMLGGFLLLMARIPWFGNLPGDIALKREGWTLYIPVTSMIIVSIVLTFIINIVFRK